MKEWFKSLFRTTRGVSEPSESPQDRKFISPEVKQSAMLMIGPPVKEVYESLNVKGEWVMLLLEHDLSWSYKSSGSVYRFKILNRRTGISYKGAATVNNYGVFHRLSVTGLPFTLNVWEQNLLVAGWLDRIAACKERRDQMRAVLEEKLHKERELEQMRLRMQWAEENGF